MCRVWGCSTAHSTRRVSRLPLPRLAPGPWTSGSRRNCVGLVEPGGGAAHAALPGAHPALAAFAVPDERCRVGIPARHRVLQPPDQFLRTVRVLPGQRAADDDAL